MESLPIVKQNDKPAFSKKLNFVRMKNLKGRVRVSMNLKVVAPYISIPKDTEKVSKEASDKI